MWSLSPPGLRLIRLEMLGASCEQHAMQETSARGGRVVGGRKLIFFSASRSMVGQPRSTSEWLSERVLWLSLLRFPLPLGLRLWRRREKDARAAYFPTLSLSGSSVVRVGLSSLFSGPHSTWSLCRRSRSRYSRRRIKSTVRFAKAQRDSALVQYERTIQTAFTEVSNALIAHQR